MPAPTREPPGCEKLAGGAALCRVRQGVCRIADAIHDEQVVVVAIPAGRRGEVCRGLQMPRRR